MGFEQPARKTKNANCRMAMEAISLSATTTYPESFSGTRNTNLGDTQGPASRTFSNSGVASRSTGLGEFQGPASRTPSNSGFAPSNTGLSNGHRSAGHQDSARTASSNPRRGGSTGPDLASRAHGAESPEFSLGQYVVSNPSAEPDLVFGGRCYISSHSHLECTRISIQTALHG